MVAEQLPQQAITRVWARNFRSIERMELDLGSLTVLVGPNASGKSNIVDILRFFKDAATKGIELAIADRGGINSIQRRTSSGLTYDTEVGLRYQDRNGSAEYCFVLAKGLSAGYRIRRENLTLEFSSSQVLFETLTVQLRDGHLAVSELFHKPSRGSDSKESIEYMDAELSRWSIDDDFGDQDLVLLQNRAPISRGFLPDVRLAREAHPDTLYLGLALRRGFARFLDHLNGMGFYRIFPNSLREPQRMQESKSLLEGGENLASTLLDMQRKDNRFISDLNQALNYISPGIRDIRVTAAGSYLVVELEHRNSEDAKESIWFDLSDQSDGTLRLLGLLVALFQEPPPTLFAIEEPEMNIHPGGMAVLMDTIAEATHRGQALITTHSPELLNLVPAESIRAVSKENGATRVGMVADYQLQSVLDGLFSAGELHSMEGLLAAEAEG